MDGAGNADPAGFGQRLQARRDIDAVAEDVVALGDDVAKVDPHAKPDATPVRNLGIAIDHSALDLGHTAHRVDDAGEFRQHPVAGGLDDAAVMPGDLRIDQLVEMRLEAFVGPFLVCFHKARIAATSAARIAVDGGSRP